MASVAEMQPLAPAGYRRAPEMKEKVEVSAVDLEAGTGETLYPGISRGESALRWGFVRKVYGILAAQLLLTTAVSALTVLHPTLNATLSDSPGLALVLAVLPFILMIPLYHYQHKHPHNFVFLGLFTLCLSFSIGVACANTQGIWVPGAYSVFCSYYPCPNKLSSDFLPTGTCVSCYVRRAWSFGLLRLHPV
ncbi:unnamed protein product [Urochloa decumbens]|uniref:BI1-like protein n=1 Tax=Urochloa decumbens TaxID=240449 RepID=A0ABC8VLV1_9POAL